MSRRVFLTGGSGVIGRAAVPALRAAGWDVDAAVRSDDAAAVVEAGGARPVVVDLFDARAVARAAAGHDAIVHLATAVPPMSRMHRKPAWTQHNRLRVDATRVLLDAARLHGITRFVKESVTFTYRDGGDAWLDEAAPVDAVPVWQPTLEGERLAGEHTRHGGDGVVLRFGALYAAGARSTDEYRRLARLHLAPVTGRPDAYLSSLHADDAATAVVAALTVAPRTYNVVDDRPLVRAEYTAAVARAFGVGRLRTVPVTPMRLLAGDAVRAVSASQRVDNRAFRDATGWRPRWTDAVEGWSAIGAELHPRPVLREVP